VEARLAFLQDYGNNFSLPLSLPLSLVHGVRDCKNLAAAPGDPLRGAARSR